jgi:hypothetical protein
VCDWLEKTLDIIGVVGGHWPDAEYIVGAARRGLEVFRLALRAAP